MTKRCMTDLETMSLENDAAIIAIGACLFNKEGIQAEFYCSIKLASSMKAGLHVSAGTIEWWVIQEKAAQAVLKDEDRLTLEEALLNFNKFIEDNVPADEEVEMWGNGSDFDNVVLTNAYKAAGIEKPWSYHGNRCYRTLKNLAPQVELQRIGVHHNALDDAKSQAYHLIDILKELKID